VSLAAGTPAQIPMSLSIFAVGIFAIYLVGAFLVPETKGNLR
jgi:MHS family proline/betaine transporter-like MFS transporter